MQFKAIVFASLATLAFGQVTSTSSAVRTTTTSTCAAQNILDACLGTTKPQVNACGPNDWDCLCNAWGVVATCYNNCPGDAGAFGVQQSRDAMCAAAAAYGTKTSSKTVAAAATSAATLTTSVSRTGSASGSAASATSTHNAAANIQVCGGMIAVALAGLSLLA